MTTNKKFSFDIQRFDSQNVLWGGTSGIYGGAGGLSGVSGSTDIYEFVGFGESVAYVDSGKQFKIGSVSVGLAFGSTSSTVDVGVASSNATIKLETVSGGMKWSGLTGTVSVALGSASSSGFNQLGLSIAKGTAGATFNVTGNGGNATGQTLTSGGLKFDTVANNWVLTKGSASVALTTDGEGSVAIADDKNVTLNGAAGRNYLDFTLDTTGSLSMVGVHTTLKADSIAFGGISGATLVKDTKGYTLINDTTPDTITVNDSASFVLAASASAFISGTGTNASVVAISGLSAGTSWQVGNATAVTLGNENWAFSAAKATLTSADGSHANVATLSGGTATLGSASGITGGVQFNAGSWSFAGNGGSATLAAFDANGGITSLKVNGSEGAVITNANADSVAAVSTGGADKLTLAGGASIALNGTANITAVNGGLAANTAWTVGASSISFSSTDSTKNLSITFGKQADSVYGVLTADSVGTAIASVASLAGNAVVHAAGFSNALADTPFALNVMSKNWTIAKDSDGSVSFDTLGNASVNGSTVYVAGDDGAQVTVLGDMNGATLNGANVTLDGADTNNWVVGLETAETGAGIASIGGVGTGNASLRVENDNSFVVGTGKSDSTLYTVASSGTDSITNVYFDGSQMNVTMKAGDAYTVQGGKAHFVVKETLADVDNSSLASNRVVTINGTEVSLGANSSSDVLVDSEGTDAITAITIGAGDAIYTGDDKEFKVVVKAGTTSDTDTTVVTVNDTRISIASSLLSAITTDTTLNVDQSGDTPSVTINGGLATTADYSVTSGVYKVGQNSADTITDDTGYISVSSGTAVAENTSTKLINESLESAISSLAGDTVGTAINAYQAFYDLSKVPATVSSSATVANWENDDDSIPAAVEGNTGYNIFADTLTSAAKSVTLQANGSTTASAAIVVAKNESNSLANAVIDLSNSARTHQVIVGGASNSSVTANHTVIGSSAGDTIVFGDNATGSNVAKAGSGNTYLVNTTSSVKNKKSSLIGGAGDDTIVAGAGDYVEGGSGADFFKDSAAYQINDYSVEDGDIIIASKLSSLGIAKLEQLSLNGNVIQVNGGAKVTLGTDYDENNSMSAVIAGADGSTANAKYVAWASAYGSTVDASSRESAAIIVGAENEGAGDLLQGSAKNDTIYAGGNDSVLSGAGADYITLKSADTDNGELGAMVALAAGKNTVDGWNTGFDNETGDNILYHEGGAEGISVKSSSGLITAYGSEGSMTFAGTESNDYFNFLVGVPTDDDEDNGLDKVTFIKSGNTAYVSADSMVADVYYGEKKNGITFTSGVEKELNIDLGGDAYTNIVSVNAGNANAATIMGAEGSVKEFVTVSGAAENGAGKTVSLGGGNDLIVSAGTNVSTAGHTFQFGAGDGKDTITNFGFYQATDTEVESADLIQLSSFASVKGTGSKVEISTTSSDKVILTGATANDVIRVKIGEDDAAVYNVKVGNSSGNSNFTYADNAQLYYGNASKGKDVLNFSAESDKSVGVWLTKSLENSGFKDSNGNTYIGVGVVNASSLTSASATLVGADGANNTLIGAGASSYTSLWGGIGGKNSLVGGVGEDTFVFFQGNGNNDTVSSYNSAQKDVVWLANISLNDIDLSKMSGDLGISTGKVEIVTNDGSKLTVNPTSTTATFRLSDGSEWVANTRTKTWGVA